MPSVAGAEQPSDARNESGAPSLYWHSKDLGQAVALHEAHQMTEARLAFSGELEGPAVQSTEIASSSEGLSASSGSTA